MDVVPLGPGFAAELRGVTLMPMSPRTMPHMRRRALPSRNIPFWSFAARR